MSVELLEDLEVTGCPLVTRDELSLLDVGSSIVVKICWNAELANVALSESSDISVVLVSVLGMLDLLLDDNDKFISTDLL